MSGVCVKHDRYVQPGEACPYCEPEETRSGLWIAGRLGIGPLDFLYPLPQPPPAEMHSRLGPLRDLGACPGCGKSGYTIMAAGETYKTHPCFQKAP